MTLRQGFFALALILSFPAAAADSPQADIQKVVDTFQTALRTRDTKTLGSLFLPEGKSWYTALGKASFESVKAKHPEVKPYKAGTWQEFADFVGSAKGTVEERFHNVQIHTDGTVGTVYFDFEFLMDGKVGNHGAETWQMLRTPEGWKIVAMLYSSNF